MELTKNQLLKTINECEYKTTLVQIIELATHKLDLKTISNYAKDNNIIYNGAKNFISHLKIDGIKFVVEGISIINLPF